MQIDYIRLSRVSFRIAGVLEPSDKQKKKLLQRPPSLEIGLKQ
jgi:hypothetical protein